jgi:PAS domain-containing protein
MVYNEKISVKFFQLPYFQALIIYFERTFVSHSAQPMTIDISHDDLSSLVLLQQIIETLPVRVFWKDTELRYLGCNSLFARDAGGQSPADIIGKLDYDLAWHEQAKLYRADDQQVMRENKVKLAYQEPQTTAVRHVRLYGG